MTVLHFLESLRPFGQKGNSLRWGYGLSRTLQCPACHTTARMQTRRSIVSPYVKHRRFRLYDCPKCATAHFPDLPAPVYENLTHVGLTKFYVEQGAGLDSMIAPYFWILGNTTKSLLEVGCGYGFSLDFAHQAMGWNVLGIDPSHLARTGASELGIPIQDGYLDADTKLEGIPFDLVVSSEVIEHIADPDPFIDALAMAAGTHGTILLTTPDIEGLRKERAIENTISLVSPGLHLVLFSKDGLTRCLKRKGFAHVRVWSVGDTIYAFASQNTIEVDFSIPVDQNVLSQYLQNCFNKKNLPPHLLSGHGARLLRVQTNAGNYEGAQNTFSKLCAHWKAIYDIDISAPETIEKGEQRSEDFFAYSSLRPFNLTSVLYFGGVLALNASHDRDLALQYFKACIRNYRITEQILATIYVSDLEGQMLAQSARLYNASILSGSAPDKAILEFEKIGESIAPSLGTQYEKTRMEVFAAAANSGDYASAERLRPAVEAALKPGPCQDDFEHAAAIGLAMIALNYRFDRPDGLYWLRKALTPVPDGPQWEGMRKVWQKQAAAYGTELLVHGGQPAFTRKRDIIGGALQDATLSPKDFAIAEALGLAYMADQPHTALAWLEKALPLADEDHRGATTARIADAQTRIFLNAVNTGDAQNAAETCATATSLADAHHNPGLHFALGLDALNRRCDLDEAAKRFTLAADQNDDPSLRIQGAFHLALVQARIGNISKAQETAEILYSKANPHAALVAQLVGNRQAELDAAIAAAA
ncbi:MAG: methyltransferase domain-containing protein [Robiginitomaculum sp.]|nr:methyltransferase domain-containing protein [Robiginitomaculum sp.]MDQ7076315.1 methyltransferase domain-containing protein [Robiginitomaculum sp.]